MSKVKILVVEDEIVIADNICFMLEELGYFVYEPVINYTEAVQFLQNENPDLLILDIQLAGSKDGIDLAWYLKENYQIPFIFLTSNADAQTIERAKKLAPPGYLVKPFVKADLYTSIELALYNFYGESIGQNEKLDKDYNYILTDSLFVKSKSLFYKVKMDDIIYLKAEHVYVELNLNSGKKHLIRNSMNAFCQKMPDNFFRVHRSYAINIKHLDAINTSYVIVADEQIPIGKSYREDLLKQIRIE